MVRKVDGFSFPRTQAEKSGKRRGGENGGGKNLTMRSTIESQGWGGYESNEGGGEIGDWDWQI